MGSETSIKDLLADALLQHFAKFAEKKVTVNSLCKDCFIDRSTFYYYFDSLDELAQYLFHRDLIDPFQNDVLTNGMDTAVRNVLSYLHCHKKEMKYIASTMKYAYIEQFFSTYVTTMFKNILTAEKLKQGVQPGSDYLIIHTTMLTGFLTFLFWEYVNKQCSISPEKISLYVSNIYEAILSTD